MTAIDPTNSDAVRSEVRKAYAGVATKAASGCCGPSCCGAPAALVPELSERLGYSREDLAAAPDGANMGLGCGNPQAIAALRPGETVLDLGSGGGFDCFLASRQVGPTGHVIGVDMTPEMISKARRSARDGGYTNVEFRLGEIEALPVADESVDVVMSNCVINLSPDKPAVFRDMFRALRPGGRVAISDVVATSAMPDGLRREVAAITGCIAGAAMAGDVSAWLGASGFEDVRVQLHEETRALVDEWLPGAGAGRYVVSASIEARKPRR